MVRVETDMSAQMGHVRFSPDSGNITDIAALRICGQTENTRHEQMSSALPPLHEVAALQPAAREQEPRGR
jgi:hypothetical protein